MQDQPHGECDMKEMNSKLQVWNSGFQEKLGPEG